MSTEVEALKVELEELKKQMRKMRPKWYTTCAGCGNTFVVYSEREGRARALKCNPCRGLGEAEEEPVFNAA